jgi:SAM-dependent methyltransferase
MDIDTTKPNIGRIYDYVLGGHHNFEVDRIAAQDILKMFPSYPRWARLNRWFLQLMAERWNAEGFERVLDLGSGMPTQGHFHTIMPHARVLYTDNDPMTVAYASEVLGNNHRVRFMQVDILDTARLLAATEQHFGGERKIAIGSIGVAYFINDTNFARLMRVLHDWAAPGSALACSFPYGDLSNPRTREIMESFHRNSSAEVFMRDELTMSQLCSPWRVRELQPLARLLDVEHLVEDTDRENVGAEMYGAILEHAGQI